MDWIGITLISVFGVLVLIFVGVCLSMGYDTYKTAMYVQTRIDRFLGLLHNDAAIRGTLIGLLNDAKESLVRAELAGRQPLQVILDMPQ